jgi:hypothetical protein
LSVILPPKIYNEVFRELDSIELTSPKWTAHDILKKIEEKIKGQLYDLLS